MKKNHFISLAILLLFFSTGANAQTQTAAKSVYFELGGAGLASINYDMRFQKKNDGFGFKAGVGGFVVDGTQALFIPVGLNYLFSKDQRNYFEIGLGVTFASVDEDYYDDPSDFAETFGHAFFGYRLQPKDGGFLFRAGITPVFNKDGFIPYWGGVSFGYKF